MAQVIQDAVAATRQLVADNQMRLTLALPPAVPNIVGDRDQLIQALVNLISNAVKFCEPRTGRILISLTQDRNQLKVSVRDNGIGIGAENQNAVFEQFRQITQPTGRGRPQGSGLGLAITKRIIDRHKGRIWVESRLGEGATFNFELPVLMPIEKLQTG
jgi:signal transduction histidine kinase